MSFIRGRRLPTRATFAFSLTGPSLAARVIVSPGEARHVEDLETSVSPREHLSYWTCPKMVDSHDEKIVFSEGRFTCG